MDRTCTHCAQPIGAERLEALPDTTTCVGCSTVRRVQGFNIYSHSKGTAPELVLVAPTDRESLRLARRANARRR